MKRNDASKGRLVEAIWDEHKEELVSKVYDYPDKDIEESTKKVIERLIPRIEEAFLANPTQFQRKEKKMGKYANLYEYSNEFILVSRYIADLRFKRMKIDGMSVDVFLKNCKKLKESPLGKDVIDFHAMASFFNGFYKYCMNKSLNSQYGYIKDLWIASLNLGYLESSIRFSKKRDGHMEKGISWLSENGCELKKKILLYCVSSRKGNISFAGKELSELMMPL